jgi:hypothetical protein
MEQAVCKQLSTTLDNEDWNLTMDQGRWVGITIKTGDEPEEWFGELDCTLDEFFQAPDGAYIRLNHSRWLETATEFEEPSLIRNEDVDTPFTHHLYFRKGDVSLVRPLRKSLRTSDDDF